MGGRRVVPGPVCLDTPASPMGIPTVSLSCLGTGRRGALLDWPKSVGAEGDLTREMDISGGFASFYICNKVSYICHNGQCEQFLKLTKSFTSGFVHSKKRELFTLAVATNVRNLVTNVKTSKTPQNLHLLCEITLCTLGFGQSNSAPPAARSQGQTQTAHKLSMHFADRLLHNGLAADAMPQRGHLLFQPIVPRSLVGHSVQISVFELDCMLLRDGQGVLVPLKPKR